jgi:hypothetical protein
MPGCATRCTTFSKNSIEDAWTDIRYHFGPRVSWSTEAGSIAVTDLEDWTDWATSNGVNTGDVDKFGKWLIWKCSYGTNNYGNLPTRIRDHEGISCIMCPYDSNSDPDRTRIWLGLESTDSLPTQTDHGEYYMKVSQRGSHWGFECTYSGCSYLSTTGHPYFHA